MNIVCSRLHSPSFALLLFLALGLNLFFMVSYSFAHLGHEDGGADPMSSMSFGVGALSPQSPEVSIIEEGSFRVIRSNGLPNHATGNFPNRNNPNSIAQKTYFFKVPLSPTIASQPTSTGHHWFGVAINGVPFEPGTQEHFNNDPSSSWYHEAIGGESDLGIDQSLAHVQPNGAYHYHGIPVGLLAVLGGERGKMTLVGWAADGFPIYGTLGYDQATNAKSPLRTMRSSYRLKTGERPKSSKDPGGKYDGNYTQDFEYVPGLGDLDQCNGRFGVTPEFPQGIYHYFCTEDFPRVSRYWKGIPDPSFRKQGPPPGDARRGTPNGNGFGDNGRPTRGTTRDTSIEGQGPLKRRGEGYSPQSPFGGIPPAKGEGSLEPRGVNKQSSQKPNPVNRFDKDGDYKISRSEAPPPMLENFSRHDLNRDGYIDQQELRTLPRPGRGSAPH